MAGSRIKGITVEIGGDTTNLEKSLKNVDKTLRTTQSNLKDINKLLKLDPTNTQLLKQKQEELSKAIAASKDRVKELKNALKEMKNAPNAAETVGQQKALQREIVATQQETKKLQEEYRSFGSVASAQLREVGEKMKEVGGKVTDVGKGLTTKLTAPILAVGAIGVSYNAQIEQFRTMFTTLTGSAEEADRIITQLQQDAQQSPFDSKSLIEANQYLISAGVEANDARQTILDLGNAIAATGGGSAELSRMAQNLQQIKNVGKASSQDIKQFANAGINIYGLLADSMGKTVEQVKDMDISYDVLADALSKASAEGGQYYGAMEAQSQTLNGSLSSTKESIQMLLGQITEAAMPVIVQVLGYVKQVISYLMNLDDSTKRIILIVAAVVAAIGPVVAMIGTIISGVGTLTTAISFLIGPLGWIPLAIAAVVAAGVLLYQNWDTIKAKAAELWAKIQEVFTNIKQSIADSVEAIKEKLQGFIDKIRDLFDLSSGLSKIGDFFSGIGSKIGGLFSSGGYMSAGYMSGGTVTIYNSFAFNGIDLNDRQAARRFADMITDRVDENLGRRYA